MKCDVCLQQKFGQAGKVYGSMWVCDECEEEQNEGIK